MMEWVLPTETRLRYFALHNEVAGVRTALLYFARARGADSSANIRIQSAPQENAAGSAGVASVPSRRSSTEHTSQLRQRRDFLLRARGRRLLAGVFGGLYAPPLRDRALAQAHRAESLPTSSRPAGVCTAWKMLDYDADGAPELLFTAQEYQALLKAFRWRDSRLRFSPRLPRRSQFHDAAPRGLSRAAP